MAATALDPGGVSYEEFVRLHAEEFRRHLSKVLEADGAHEGAGFVQPAVKREFASRGGWR